jgi:hypothetical protein
MLDHHKLAADPKSACDFFEQLHTLRVRTQLVCSEDAEGSVNRFGFET